ARDGGLIHPLRLEVLRVGRRDLRERAVPIAEITAGVDQPVPRFLGRVQQTVVADLRLHAVGHRGREKEYQCCGGRSSRHDHRPLSESSSATTSASSSGSNLSLNDGIGETVRIVYSRRSLFVRETSFS